MQYIPKIDEDDGFCPRCNSSDTLTIRATAKRACLKCGFSEEFESYAQAVRAWQVKGESKGEAQKNARKARASISEEAKSQNAASVSRPGKKVEKIIESVEKGVTRVTIPTPYREDFNRYVKSRGIELSGPPQTDIWDNVESAYTVFELKASYPLADGVFSQWVGA
jgi:Zn ribbon nucleic-acid-binding protein